MFVHRSIHERTKRHRQRQPCMLVNWLRQSVARSARPIAVAPPPRGSLPRTHTRAREGIKTAAHARARHQSLARPRSLAPILATTPSPSLPATPKNPNVLQRLVRRCCLRARGNNALTRERCAPQGRHPPCLWGEPSAKPPAPVGR